MRPLATFLGQSRADLGSSLLGLVFLAPFGLRLRLLVLGLSGLFLLGRLGRSRLGPRLSLCLRGLGGLCLLGLSRLLALGLGDLARLALRLRRPSLALLGVAFGLDCIGGGS